MRLRYLADAKAEVREAMAYYRDPSKTAVVLGTGPTGCAKSVDACRLPHPQLPLRRPASYEIFDIRNNKRRAEPLDRVNKIRGRVDAWRAAGCPGATPVSSRRR